MYKIKIYFFLICFPFFTVLISCKKNTESATPQTCYLSSISNSKGDILEKFSYDSNNRLITDTSDSSNVTFGFTYNSQNLISQISINGTINYGIALTYNASGQIQKAVISDNGKTYITNIYNYTNSLITSVASTDFMGNSLNTRFEYVGENISKVYRKSGTAGEYLFYEISKFDDKKNLYPEAYRYLGLGLIGIVNGFQFINKNNAITENFYYENGTLGATQANNYEYNATTQPTKLTEAYTFNGKTSTTTSTYQYNCK